MGELESLLALVGAVSVVPGLVQFAVPQSSGSWPSALSLASLVVYGDWEVEIVRGNLLDFEPIVVTADRRFSVGFDTMGASTLVGQLIGRLGSSAVDQFRASLPSVADRLVEPGETVLVLLDGASPARVFVVACGVPGPSASETPSEHLWTVYSGLWRCVRRNRVVEVSLPVVGAGFSGSRLSHSAVPSLLVLSLHAASLDSPVCRRARIVVAERDWTNSTIPTIQEFLGAIGYVRLRTS